MAPSNPEFGSSELGPQTGNSPTSRADQYLDAIYEIALEGGLLDDVLTKAKQAHFRERRIKDLEARLAKVESEIEAFLMLLEINEREEEALILARTDTGSSEAEDLAPRLKEVRERYAQARAKLLAARDDKRRELEERLRLLKEQA